MSEPNVFAPEWEPGTPPGLHGVRVGAAAGAQELGVTLYELEPGAVVAFPRGADGAHQVTNPGEAMERGS